MNIDSADDRDAFERRCLDMAEAIRHCTSGPFDLQTPTQLALDLHRIDKALTVALQILVPLHLRHKVGQDLEVEPFNWPLVTELSGGRMTAEILRGKGPPAHDFVQPSYPTKLIDDMIELRDAARHACKAVAPKRGNSSKRTARTALIDEVARNFVFHYRAHFGNLPPISQTGWAVDLLAAMLKLAGVAEADAAVARRRGVERDPMRSHLPSAKAAHAALGGSNASTPTVLRHRRRT